MVLAYFLPLFFYIAAYVLLKCSMHKRVEGKNTMVESVVGLQQIITIIAFLAVMIGALIYLRMKGGGLRRSLHQGKRIQVVEETGISPLEKMRLIKIDNQEFIVISAKGVQPVITPLGHAKPAEHAVSAQTGQPALQGSEQSPLVLSEKMAQTTPAKSSQENQVSSSAFQRALEKAAGASDEGGELSAFSEKFKSWRMS